MNLHIISMGFDVTHILSKVRELSPTREDIFYFVRSRLRDAPQTHLIRKREMAEESIKLVFDPLSRYVGVRYRFIELDDTSLTSSILRLFDETMVVDGEPYTGSIYIWALGGSKSLVSILVLYGQIDPRVKKIHVFTEGAVDFPEVPTMVREYIYGRRRIRQLYKLLESLEMGNPVPADVGGKIISRLVRDGLIVRRSGRKRRLEITDIGRIYMRRYQILTTR